MTITAETLTNTPYQSQLTDIQARRLASQTGLPLHTLQALVGRPLSEVADRLRLQIDPSLLLFRKVEGRVVKKDPVTGANIPVPFATVYVEDVDAGFLGYFPGRAAQGWLYPLFARTEVLATVQTDCCGKFCAYIPWFDIDYILTWRRERFCFPAFFQKPRLIDIIQDVLPGNPGDPVETNGQVTSIGQVTHRNAHRIQRLNSLIGETRTRQLVALEENAAHFSGSTQPLQALLNEAAYLQPQPPKAPARLPREWQNRLYELTDNQTADHIKANNGHLDVQRFIGPFIHCADILVPEWTPILDVPDVIFRVTQDVNGDGVEETIYSEGFFDTRWNVGPVTDVTLFASPIAVAQANCCDNPTLPSDQVGIQLIGAMKLGTIPGGNLYHDNTATGGFALRTNRPHSSGHLRDYTVSHPGADDDGDGIADGPAQTPFGGTLQLYGKYNPAGAAYYRVRYRLKGPGDLAFSGPATFFQQWQRIRNTLPYDIKPVAPDASGWYDIPSNPADWYFGDVVLNWASSGIGLYEVYLEFADDAKLLMPGLTSGSAYIAIDNVSPTCTFEELHWKYADQATYGPAMELICPVIHRDRNRAINIKVRYSATAPHLKYVTLTGNGCESGALQEPPLTSQGDRSATVEHWHTNVNDNSYETEAEFTLPAGSLDGAYGFNLLAVGRSFNPAFATTPSGTDFYTDNPNLITYQYNQLNLAIVGL